MNLLEVTMSKKYDKKQANISPKCDEEQPKRGEPGKDGFVTTTQENELGALYITVPHILVEKMGWNGDDNIEVSTTENCFDWGEVSSIVLRNLTKEENDK